MCRLSFAYATYISLSLYVILYLDLPEFIFYTYNDIISVFIFIAVLNVLIFSSGEILSENLCISCYISGHEPLETHPVGSTYPPNSYLSSPIFLNYLLRKYSNSGSKVRWPRRNLRSIYQLKHFKTHSS